MSFKSLLESFRKSIQVFPTKAISARDVRLVKILEYLEEKILSVQCCGKKDIDDLRILCESRDYALEAMIRRQNELLDRQTKVLRHISESFKILDYSDEN
jgi:hypothetical protein